jgi:hypothetical protein
MHQQLRLHHLHLLQLLLQSACARLRWCLAGCCCWCCVLGLRGLMWAVLGHSC